MKLKKKEIWLYLYTFLAIFQPPILPISFIYVFGAVTAILIIIDKAKIKNYVLIAKENGSIKLYKLFLLMALYAIFISIVNVIFIDSTNLTDNRLKCLNQLLVLTGIQLLSVSYILKTANSLNYSFYDILRLIMVAGILQGICAVLAYLFPTIRKAFTHFGGEIYQSAYVWERRGYGFSGILLDTFGYGMGLIAGCALLTFNKNKLIKILSLVLSLVATLLNARTGIIVFAIAFIMFICKNKKNKISFLRIVFLIPIMIAAAYFIAPLIFEVGLSSDNTTVVWVISGLRNMYNAVFSGEFGNASFISDYQFSTNIFELIFGSGHSIYGIQDIIGFHSDIGYVNMVWTYGIIGSGIILFALMRVFVNAYCKSKDNIQKLIVVFLGIAYLVVMIKAILIGSNPGTMITYLILFSMTYFGERESKRLKCYGKRIKRYCYA